MLVKFNINPKTIKKAMAILELDIPSDKKIEKRFSDIIVDISDSDDEDVKQAELGFAFMAIGKVLEVENKN